MSEMNLGTAWLDVVPSFKGIHKSIRSELGGIDTQLNSHASGWGRKISGTLSNAFTTAGKMAVAGLTIATGFISSYAGEAIRASDATDKFKSTLDFAGLDNSKIDALTKSAQKYADLTVYDLSDIQSITAQLASNGVKGFDKLAEAAGNLNAVAGGNKETFKSVGMVITQTAGLGKLTAENWRQLSDAIPGAAGPIKKALQEAGAYTGNFTDAMSKGEISADEFNAAISSLGMTDVAEQAAKSTKTMEGAWGNFEAAIVGGLKDTLAPVKGALTSFITDSADKLTGFFQKVSGGVKSLQEAFSSGTLNLDLFKGLGPVIGGLTGLLGPLLSSLPVVGGLFTGLTGPVGLLIGGLTQMFINSKDLRDSFGKLGKALSGVFGKLAPVLGKISGLFGELLGKIGDGLAPVIDGIADAFTMFGQKILPAVLPVLAKVFSLFGKILGPVVKLASAIGTGLVSAFTAAMPAFGKIAELVSKIADVLAPIGEKIMSVLAPALEKLGPVIDAVFSTIGTVIGSALEVISGIISTFLSLITGDWEGAWNGLGDIVSGVWDIISGLVSGGLNVVSGLISAGWELITGAAAAAWDGVTGIISSAWDGISSATSSSASWVASTVSSAWDGIKSASSTTWSAVTSTVSSAWDGISSATSSSASWVESTVSAGWESAKSLTSSAWSSMADSVSSGVSSVMGYVGSMPDRISGFFSNAGSWLYNAGRDIIQGLIGGIKSAFGWVQDTLSSLTSMLPDWKGPAPVDRVLLKPAGKMIIGGFVDGLESQYSTVRKSLNSFTHSLKPNMTMGANLGNPVAGMTPASAGPVFHIGAINNPVREPSSTSLSKELAKVSAGVGSLV